METPEKLPNETRDLILYFILAFAFSWAIGIPLALAHQDIISPVLPQWTHYLIGYGPLLSALIVTGFSGGTVGLRELGRRMFKWACPKWVVVSLSPLLIGGVIILILNGITNGNIRLSDLGAVNYLPPLGIGALAVWILTFGLGEETGWRGFALPRLQKGRSALTATLILAAVWALWHLPQYFYLYEPSMAFGWVISLFAGAIFLTWLYNSSPDSILMVSIWHGCFNFITASSTDTGLLPSVISGIVIVLAILVIWRAKPKELMSL